MDDTQNLAPPTRLEAILHATAGQGFTLSCEPQTGSLLRTLVSTKPGGQFLELGTGTGVSTCWILDGMDAQARLTSVDLNAQNQSVAREFLGHDPRISFVTMDGLEFLAQAIPNTYDFIFADTWPGKFQLRDVALGLLKPGGLYVVDDLSPQPTWPDNHLSAVTTLITELEQRKDLHITKLAWASGLIVASMKAHDVPHGFTPTRPSF